MTEELRTRILEEADRLFTQRGIRLVSVNDICQGLHISKKTFYQYFPQKEDIVRSVISFHIREKEKQSRALFEGKNSIEVLRSAVEFLDKNKFQGRNERRLRKELEKYYPAILEEESDSRQKFLRDGVKTYLKEGIEEGYFRDDIDWRAFFYFASKLHDSMVAYLDSNTVTRGRIISARTMIRTFTDIVVNAILTEKGRQEYYRTEI